MSNRELIRSNPTLSRLLMRCTAMSGIIKDRKADGRDYSYIAFSFGLNMGIFARRIRYELGCDWDEFFDLVIEYRDTGELK